MMKVKVITRKIYEDFREFYNEAESGEIQVGDKLKVLEPGEEGYVNAMYIIADIGRKKIRLIREEILCKKQMKDDDFDLMEWLNSDFKESLMEINNIDIKKVTLPTTMNVYGETQYDEEAKGRQWELFKNPKERIAMFEGHSAGWWLRGAVSASLFALVYHYGTCSYHNASAPWVGVRPALILRS